MHVGVSGLNVKLSLRKARADGLSFGESSTVRPPLLMLPGLVVSGTSEDRKDLRCCKSLFFRMESTLSWSDNPSNSPRIPLRHCSFAGPVGVSVCGEDEDDLEVRVGVDLLGESLALARTAVVLAFVTEEARCACEEFGEEGTGIE